MKETWILIAFFSGAILPIQAGLNTRLGKAAGNPIYASLISFIVGVLVLIAYILATRQPLNTEGLRTTPYWSWFGGILGAFYVTAVVMAFPKLGAALTFGLLVAGQMLAALLLDHFNLMVAQQQPINIWKILGMLMIVGGVVIIRKF